MYEQEQSIVKLWDRKNANDYISKINTQKIEDIQHYIESCYIKNNFNQQKAGDVVKIYLHYC